MKQAVKKERDRQRQANVRAERLAAGLCPYCGKGRDKPGRKSCGPCLAAGKRAWKRFDLKWRYGLTIEQFNSMLDSQGNCCALCTNPFDPWPCVDHNHVTEKVRSLLCNRCNLLIGFLEPSPTLALRAIIYLVEHNGRSAGETF